MDKRDLEMLWYCWAEKGDITRYIGFDKNEVREQCPELWNAWTVYKKAKDDIDFAFYKLLGKEARGQT